ncbi:hypothetical protein [Sphingorhabdus sp.]|uniref:hypothetical protein n=1 Tax=Sphingorhabdus sp. TaxID=1902408 RepID=UPI003918B04F
MKKAPGSGQNRSHGDSTSNHAKSGRHTTAKSAQARKGTGKRKTPTEVPSWLGAVMSVVGVGVAVGAGLYATRHQWMPKAGAWKDDFSAAFADDETDYENFDQTRHAGAESMRDDQPDDWNDVDDMSDASFPASDPPSFTPGTAS